MKLQIDTENKTIKIDESVNLGELSEVLLKLFPKLEWKEYSLIPNTVITKECVHQPDDGVRRWPSPYTPGSGTPWWEVQPFIMYSTDTISSINTEDNQKLFNIEITTK